MASKLTQTDELADRHALKINAMINDFEASGSGQVQAFGSALRQLLKDAGLATQEHVMYIKLIPHPDNREGELLIPIGVWNLLMKIVEKGWSWFESQLALCCMIPPASHDAWCTKAVKLTKDSDGLLAPYRVEDVTDATAAGSHTTAVLQLVHYSGTHNFRVPDGDKFLKVSLGGILNQDLILAACPSLKEPLQKGLNYLRLRHEIVSRCPALMRILSEADNAKHQVQAKESPMQTMLNIYRRAVETNPQTSEDWNAVALRSARGQGGDEFLTQTTQQAKFVEELAGDNGVFLHDLDRYWKTLRKASQLSPQLLYNVATSGTWIAKMPRLAIAVVKFDLQTIDVCISNTDLTDIDKALKLGGTKAAMITAVHTAMMQFRDLGLQAGASDETAFHRIVGNFDATCVALITSKWPAGRKKYTDVKEICIEFFNMMCADDNLKQFMSAAMSPWATVALASDPTSSTQSRRAMKHHNVMGSSVTPAYCERLGFRTSAQVRMSDDKILYRIISCTSDGALLVRAKETIKDFLVCEKDSADLDDSEKAFTSTFDEAHGRLVPLQQLIDQEIVGFSTVVITLKIIHKGNVSHVRASALVFPTASAKSLVVQVDICSLFNFCDSAKFLTSEFIDGLVSKHNERFQATNADMLSKLKILCSTKLETSSFSSMTMFTKKTIGAKTMNLYGYVQACDFELVDPDRANIKASQVVVAHTPKYILTALDRVGKGKLQHVVLNLLSFNVNCSYKTVYELVPSKADPIIIPLQLVRMSSHRDDTNMSVAMEKIDTTCTVPYLTNLREIPCSTELVGFFNDTGASTKAKRPALTQNDAPAKLPKTKAEGKGDKATGKGKGKDKTAGKGKGKGKK